MSKSILKDKSYIFAVHMIKTYQLICEKRKEYILSKQLLRSGTAIGALIREAEYAQSIPDFISKMSIGLKEANETEYWIMLLHDTLYINSEIKIKSISEVNELKSMLISSIRTAKSRLNKA